MAATWLPGTQAGGIKLNLARLILTPLLMLPLSAAAGATLYVMETEYTGGPEKTFARIDNVLAQDAEGFYLDVHPSTKVTHKQALDLLAPGVPIYDVKIQRQLAKLLGGFPTPCLDNLSLTLLVSPVEDIDQFVPGVQDKRRITAVYVGDCLAVDLAECEHDRTKTGEVDFTIGQLAGVLRRCRDSTNKAAGTSAAFSEAVYKTHPELKRPDTSEKR